MKPGLQKRIVVALADDELRAALSHARSGFVDKRRAAVSACDDFEALKRRARQARDRALDNLPSLLEQFEQRVLEAGGEVHWAENPAQMREQVVALCRAQNARYIAKGKSMVGEEVGLNAALESAGFHVDETDLGEYIIQLARETPSHIVAPALHKSRAQIGALFRAHHDLGERPLEEVQAIVREARAVLRERFLRADVGITGANLLVARTGQVVLVTNEGNGDLTASLPRCHIVTASIEKVVADHDDAAAVLRVLGRSATGQAMTAYTSYYGGPRGEGDRDGPAAFHVVLLDNGRSRMFANRYRPMLRCIKCAACMNHCPVYQNVGGHAYGAVYPGPMGSVLTPLLRGDPGDAALASATSVCGRCDSVCPVEIPLTDMMRDLRSEAPASMLVRALLKLHAAVAGFPVFYRPASAIGLRAARLLSRAGMTPRRLPLTGAWTDHKGLPELPAATFQQQWRRGARR